MSIQNGSATLRHLYQISTVKSLPTDYSSKHPSQTLLFYTYSETPKLPASFFLLSLPCERYRINIMASTLSICRSLLLVFLVVQPLAATTVGELLSPLLSPVFDDVCKDVECGKGSCKASSNSAFFFECECQPGWKQTSSGHTDLLKFLPCVIPNCTLNYSCTKAPAPIEEKETTTNETIFDPCYWSHCGTGSCNKTSKFTYNCECPAGFYNLLNISSFPCFQSCELGMDCTNLGITTVNQATSSSSSMADNTKNQASSITQGHCVWLIITMVFVRTFLSKYN